MKTKTAVALAVAIIVVVALFLVDWRRNAAILTPPLPAHKETGTALQELAAPVASDRRTVPPVDDPVDETRSAPPTDASVHVVLTDSELKRKVGRFSVWLRAHSAAAAEAPRLLRTDDGVAESVFSVTLDDPLYVRIELASPGTPGAVSREVNLKPGDDLTVELATLPGLAHLYGVVVDTGGAPIAGAVVFYGDGTTSRGDELCADPFDGRVTGEGTCSEKDGSFILLGEGEHVTAWHEHYSTSTVAASLASRIVLHERASITGVLRDGSGVGVVGARIDLDDGVAETFARDGGRFEFLNVEAGLHCLSIETIGTYLVNVSPARDALVDVTVPDHTVTIEFHRGEGLHERTLDGALLGPMGDACAAAVNEVSCKNGTLQDLLLARGRYVFLGDNGELAQLSIDGRIAYADLGTARLLIEGPPGRHVVVVPEQWAEEGTVIGCAIRFAQRMPANGSLTIEPIPVGDYRVGLVEGPGILTPVAVREGHGQVTLPQ